MDGSEKLPMTIIGKTASFRNSKDVLKLGFGYYNNSTAWMTGEIWISIWTQVNNKLIKENRNIILFVDNCSAHPILSFSNIKIIFLPPNTTSKLQPMDAGIIKVFNGLYRVKMAKKFITLV